MIADGKGAKADGLAGGRRVRHLDGAGGEHIEHISRIALRDNVMLRGIANEIPA